MTDKTVYISQVSISMSYSFYLLCHRRNKDLKFIIWVTQFKILHKDLKLKLHEYIDYVIQYILLLI